MIPRALLIYLEGKYTFKPRQVKVKRGKSAQSDATNRKVNCEGKNEK